MDDGARQPVLELIGVRKCFGGTDVLKSVDLTVGKGELVFIIGPSGSGKSTLLRCCNRLEEVDGGTIVVEGRDLARALRGVAGEYVHPGGRSALPALGWAGVAVVA
jgi:polar amino acid transport system ATP-binding protein